MRRPLNELSIRGNVVARICFVGRIVRKNSGVDRYSRNLVARVAKLSQHEIYVTFNDPPEGTKNFPGLDMDSENFFVRFIHNLFILPYFLHKGKFDIIHGLTPWSHFFSFGAKKVITVHDLTGLLFPQFHILREHIKYRIFLSNSIGRADRIIAVSKNTANDLERHLGIPKEKISVVYEGIDHSLYSPVRDEGQLRQAREKYSLPAGFILYVGNIEPRKNIPALLKAFSKIRAAHPGLWLVIAGKKGWKYREIFKMMERDSELSLNVKFIDYVEERHLPALYSLASVFVYPSLYEGFGLPPLEAMACGVPVVASSASSVPEVVGAAALLVDPKDADSIADAVIRILKDKKLAAELSRRGPERAKMFDWEKTAKETIRIYEEILNK
jgi:glycosyltransferase involved in cell wall biosynthesis